MSCGVSFFLLGMLAAAPQATAQFTCSENTYLASTFTGGYVVTCNAIDQTSLEACTTAFGSATTATIINIAAGSYILKPFGGQQPLCFQGAGISQTTLYGLPANTMFSAFAPAQMIGLTLEGNGTSTGLILNGAAGIYDVVMQNFNGITGAPISASMFLPAKLIVA